MDSENEKEKRLPCSSVFSVFFAVLPFAQIVMGAKYLNECPKQPNIPVYLVVSGVFSMVNALLFCPPTNLKSLIVSIVWKVLVSIFLFCWLISGSVWIYSIYPPNYNYNSTVTGEPYCNKTLYLFAFWTTTVGYIHSAMQLVMWYCSEEKTNVTTSQNQHELS